MNLDIVKLFSLTKKQIDLLIHFEKLIFDWNKKINLISRKDIDNFQMNHIVHSLSMSLYFQFNNGTKILDLGTGGGLPGIPLAIIFPHVNFHLIDKVGKKIAAVSDIVNSLKLRNVKTEWINVTNLNSSYDFVISRSVASYQKIFKQCENIFLKDDKNEFENGFIFYKGGTIEEEFKMVKKYYTHELFKEINLDFFNEKKIVHVPNPYTHI
tara:strand:+ start:2101 stop:2733 length:633 start_codon:yes stop_codon:yes gene_type:complete